MKLTITIDEFCDILDEIEGWQKFRQYLADRDMKFEDFGITNYPEYL